DVARLQTDSIIISSFIQVSLVGVVDNYTMVINSISGFVNIIFNSVISSFGNLIATESGEKQYEMFMIYRFVANWVYGLSAIGFYVLLSPLIVDLWLGKKWMLSNVVIALILIDYYFKGDRIVLSNFKTAAGVFEEDKYLALIQGVVNLVISIALVQTLGLAGIYIGTIISGLIANVTKPFIIYRVCFGKGAGEYFLDTAKKLLVLAVTLAIVVFLSRFLLQQITILSFLLTGIMIVLVYNLLFLLCFGRTKELGYLMGLLRRN
ncbi:MAG: polysaccharide biosynthesis protein, partial [Lachnospiraceae bacterium]|nr:polysaccharide biosynthesis protein [Lachnospiraceae bacterium]